MNATQAEQALVKGTVVTMFLCLAIAVLVNWRDTVTSVLQVAVTALVCAAIFAAGGAAMWTYDALLEHRRQSRRRQLPKPRQQILVDRQPPTVRVLERPFDYETTEKGNR